MSSSSPPFCHFTRMLYKWTHTACRLLRFLFTQQVPLRSIQVVGCTHSLPLFIAEYHPIPWTDRLSICWLKAFGLLPVWGYYEIRLLWTSVYTFLCEHTSSLLGEESPRVVTGSYGRFMCICVEAAVLFRSSCTILRPHGWRVHDPVSPHSSREFWLPLSFSLALLIDMWW